MHGGRRHDGGLKSLERKLQKELCLINRQEELIWFQRSRAKWLTDGDRNTRYYHLKAITRKRKNCISMLRDANGAWTDDDAELQNMVNNFYKNLFTDNNKEHVWFQTRFTYPTLTEENIQHLDEPVGDDDVRREVFSMGPWKAPGPDGFPAGFYQNAWEVIRHTVFEFVR